VEWAGRSLHTEKNNMIISGEGNEIGNFLNRCP